MVCINERTRPEIATSPLSTEVTPQNIDKFDFSNLNWQPHFSGEKLFGPVPDCSEIQEGESLEILIPEFAINQRVEAVTQKLAQAILANPEDFAIGAIPKGGLWLYEELMRRIERISPWGQKTINHDNHLDIKSRRATETGEYQVISLPEAQKVNGKTLLLCEGVADSLQTLAMARKVLSQPPYEKVNLRILLLLDKVGAHPLTPLPQITYPPLFTCGDVWVCGCGPDTDQRFRNLNCIAVYTKKSGRVKE